ncbi:MAG: dihydrofolate reductase [Ruminococcaceae bacterium]|nr:dihydrofolate reductase [Oscillospiraceae bacterium]
MDAVVAVYEDWGIGCRGTQPVVIPEDRRYFAALTKGACVIMGRTTMCDCPGGGPLPGRDNIILSRSCPEIEGAQVAASVSDALRLAKGHERVFVLGGQAVFSQMMPHINRIYVTKIGLTPKSDSYFPNLDEMPEWKCTDPGEPFLSGDVVCSFCVYERI